MIFASVCNAVAQDEAGAPIPLVDTTGKTGAFQIMLSERSKLSGLKDIGKRVGIKPADLGDDYDLSKEIFYVYVPKDPAEDGKFGLMVGLNFKEYGHPAMAWPPVLESKHMLWIGTVNNGDERSAAQRIGLLLDAVSNAEKTWPIDLDRVYLSMNAGKGAALGTAFYYPDIFTGMLGSAFPHWFMDLKGAGNPPVTWKAEDFPKPAGKYMSTAKTQTRVFQANRDDPTPARVTINDLIRKAYGAQGFKYVKFIKVPEESGMGHYIAYSADWFEQGIDFLDEPLAKIRAARQPRVRPLAKPIKPAGN